MKRESFKSVFANVSQETRLELDELLLMTKFLSYAQSVCDEKNLNRKDFAEKLGFSPSHLSQLFQGNKLASLKTLAKIQRALGITYQIDFKYNSDTFYSKAPLKANAFTLKRGGTHSKWQEMGREFWDYTSQDEMNLPIIEERFPENNNLRIVA